MTTGFVADILDLELKQHIARKAPLKSPSLWAQKSPKPLSTHGTASLQDFFFKYRIDCNFHLVEISVNCLPNLEQNLILTIISTPTHQVSVQVLYFHSTDSCGLSTKLIAELFSVELLMKSSSGTSCVFYCFSNDILCTSARLAQKTLHGKKLKVKINQFYNSFFFKKILFIYF